MSRIAYYGAIKALDKCYMLYVYVICNMMYDV
jgi:hypothetical protein